MKGSLGFYLNGTPASPAPIRTDPQRSKLPLNFELDSNRPSSTVQNLM